MKPSNSKPRLSAIKHKHNALLGGVIDEATFLKRQSKGVYPSDLTYRQFVWQDDVQNRSVQQQKDSLAEANRRHEAFLEAHPEEQEVMCDLDENLNQNKSRTTLSECQQRHQSYNQKKWDADPFGKIMNGLNAVTNFAMDLPIAPKAAKTALQALGPVNQMRDAVQLKGEALDAYVRRKIDALVK